MTAPCQGTCQVRKPSVCIPGPGCYCPGKDHLWDHTLKKCVPAKECSNGPGGVNAKHKKKKKGKFDIANVNEANGGHGGIQVRTHVDFGGLLHFIHKICGNVKGGFKSAGGKISGLIHGGGGGKGGGKHRAGGKGGGKGGAGGEGGASGGAGGGGGGGGSWSGSISVHGGGHAGMMASFAAFIKKIASLPIKIPKFAFKMDMKVMSLPINIVKGVVTNVGRMGKMISSNGIKLGMNIGNFDAKFVAGVIGRIKMVVGFFVRNVANVQIGGLKGAHAVTVFIQKRIKAMVDMYFKVVIFFFSNVGKAIHGGIKFSHIKQIGHRVAKLPVIRTWLHFMGFIRMKMMSISFNQVNELGVFIDGIIEKHQDVFVPVFHKIFNFFLAFVEAFHQVRDGGAKTGVSFTLGKLHLALGPLKKGDWEMCGLGGKTIGSHGKGKCSSNECLCKNLCQTPYPLITI
nr:unnamed protein product [Callosobruchus chinensis]